MMIPLLMDYEIMSLTGPDDLQQNLIVGRVLISSILQDQRTGREHYDAGLGLYGWNTSRIIFRL